MIRYEGFSDLIDCMVASFSERVALLASESDGAERSVTWREFAQLVEERSGMLADRGCSCEAILADGSVECVVEVFASVRAGLQVALMDPFVPNSQLEPLLKSVDADCVWASRKARLAEVERLLDPHAAPAFGARGVLFFTSGTTSLSKAVVLTDETLMASAFNGSSLMPLSRNDTLLCMLPLSHVFGFVCGLLWGLSCGARVALGRGPRHYADDFAAFRPTVVAVVPKLLEFLVAREALNEELELVLVGAADCSDRLLQTVRDRGIRTSLGYGLTETSSGIALSTGDDFHAMTICPEDKVAIGADGEILVEAPTCLMKGYYRDEDKTAKAFSNGILHTGDKGFLDDEGLLHVEGRLKDVLTLPGGTKVFLPEYEEAVSDALAERDVTVIMHRGRLTLVCGNMNRERSDSEILADIGQAMASYPPGSRIGGVLRLERALPRTAAGDIERWKIQEALENDNR